MRVLFHCVFCAVFVPAVAFAQAGPAFSDVPPPPPLVNAPVHDVPQDLAPPPMLQDVAPPTPLYGTVPYGAVQQPPPGAEVGLMFTETAFGILTAAGTALLPYYLLLKPLSEQSGGSSDDNAISNLLFVLVFSAVPLAVSQTELSLANGSRYYSSESWPSALAGLTTQAAVVGLYYWLRDAHPVDSDSGLLLAGTVVAVPLAEMIAINLTKMPRNRMPSPGGFGLLRYDEGQGLRAGLPLPQPLFRQTAGGLAAGVQLPLLGGCF